MVLRRARRAVLSRVDPLGWAPATASVAKRAAMNPLGVVRANASLAANLARIPLAAATMYTGGQFAPPLPADAKDKRFADAAWSENPGYMALRQYYLAVAKYVDDLLEAGHGDPLSDGKVKQLSDLMLGAVAPTSFLVTNPDALVEAYRTGGRSLAKGARFAASDMITRGGRPVKVDTKAYTLGEDMACTPGQVVYRNELIEVIQYEPQTKTVYETPLLVTPPWINKYYILDLRPGRSLVEMALKTGRTVFAISYRNPDGAMGAMGMDDYYRQGTSAALDVVQEITGAEKIDILALCLGGAMTAMAAAKDAQDGVDRLGSLTLLNAMLDYSEPGELSLMTDGAAIEMIEERMRRKGYLSEKDMSDPFDMIRANDLIFNYWVSRWMKGEEPAAFDILVWNDDATRMPARMHSEYLRGMYRDNLLCKGEFVLDGTTIDLSQVTSDCYVVGAIGDHIVPWSTSYKAVALLGGDVRYVQSNGGHLAGAVNPPSGRTWFKAIGKPEDDNREAYPTTAAEFEKVAEKHSGDSWWTDWNTWMSSRAGKKVAPPAMGCEAYPPLYPAPGKYVNNEV